jgi:hypothetical protein
MAGARYTFSLRTVPLGYRSDSRQMAFLAKEFGMAEILDAETGNRIATQSLSNLHFSEKGPRIAEWQSVEERKEKSWRWLWYGTPSSSLVCVLDVASGCVVGELVVSNLQHATISEDGHTLMTLRHVSNGLVMEFWSLPLHPPVQWVLGPPIVIFLLGLLLVRLRKAKSRPMSGHEATQVKSTAAADGASHWFESLEENIDDSRPGSETPQ